MGVTRFRTFQEAEEALWREPGDPATLRVVSGLLRFARRLGPSGAPRGVRKYRTVEDADRDRQAWEAARKPVPTS